MSHFCSSSSSSAADHPQLHAPLPAALPRGLRGPAQGQREVRGGELQDLRVRGDPLHGGHRVPEPPGRRPVGAGLAPSSEHERVGEGWNISGMEKEEEAKRPQSFGKRFFFVVNAAFTHKKATF